MFSIDNLKATLGRLAVASAVASATILAFAVSGTSLGDLANGPSLIEAASLNVAEPISPLSPVRTATITGLGFGASFVNDGSMKVIWGGSDSFAEIDQLCPKLPKVKVAACITKWSDKAITLLVPTADLGGAGYDSAWVEVVTGGEFVSAMDGGANAKYYYSDYPVILDMSTRNGPLVGGTKVTFTGLNFGASFVVDTSAVYGLTEDFTQIWEITQMCQKAPASPVKGCVSKWSNTAVTILTPDLTENGPQEGFPVIRTFDTSVENLKYAYPEGSFGDGDPRFYQGAVVIKVNSLK